MPKFILAYHGGPRFQPPQNGQQHMIDWKAWMEGLGDAVVDPGMPVGSSKTIGPDGVTNDGGSNPLFGITIVQAQDFDAALAMAGKCPHVALGGTMEVAEAMNMPM